MAAVLACTLLGCARSISSLKPLAEWWCMRNTELLRISLSERVLWLNLCVCAWNMFCTC